ncbi:MAG: response regulator [Acidobacteria bacterium]|nr:response regulator [Acidobacteriota bacterium]
MNRREQEMWSPREVARLLSLLEAERRYYQEIMAAVPSGLGIVGQDGTVQISNRALRRMFALDPLSAGDPPVSQILPSENLRTAIPLMLSGERTEAMSELSMQSDGRWLRFSLRPFRDWDDFSRLEVLLTVEESTEAAEQARADAEAGLDALRARYASLPACAWELDPATMRFTSLDAEAAAALSLAPDSWAPGADFWTSRVHPGDLARLKGFWELALRGTALRSCDYGTPTSQGRSRRLRDYWTILRDESGQLARVQGLTLDVSEEFEISRLSAQSERVEAMHELAGRIVHDSNNLLMILSGYGEELLHGLDSDHPLRAHVQEILAAGDRLSALTSHLAASTRKEAEPETRPAPIDTLLAEWLDSLSAMAGSKVDLRLECGAPGVHASTEPDRLRLGLELLLRRASAAMLAGGSIHIATRVDHRQTATARPDGALSHPSYLRIEIRDNGIALHPEARSSFFAPNLSSEPNREELARFYRFLRETGGDAMADSDYQVGTTITLFLPCTEQEPVATPPAETTTLTAAAPKETILVVDDEDGIRALMAKVLTREGYEVIEASSGEEALEKANAYWGQIPLMVTDVVMPGMGGVDLAAQLSPQRPETFVMFISGYTGQAALSTAQLARGYEFLQKPFTLSAFLGKIRAILSAPRPAAKARGHATGA